jgi:hypothetical protein
MWGYEASVRSRVWGDANAHIELLTGFRGLALEEVLQIEDDRTLLQNLAGISKGSLISIRDNFGTSNRFYGGQVGASGQLRSGPWTLDLVGKLGLGVTQQLFSTNGSSGVTPASQSLPAQNAGLLALDSNSGRFIRNRFSVVPEVGLTLGYQVNDYVRVYAGYTGLLWSGVARPGQQIDTTLDVKRIPALAKVGTPASFLPTTTSPVVPARPEIRFNDTTFWVQGLNCGVEFRY